jgi:predicted methyltransferase
MGETPVTASTENIVAAVADAARPQADKDRDANRKPADMVAFGEVRPGDKVGELIPGGGYMTRILSKAVGPTGKVYVFASQPVAREGQPPPAAPVAAITADTANYGNVQVVISNFATIANPEPLDRCGRRRTITTCTTPAATSTSMLRTRRSSMR